MIDTSATSSNDCGGGSANLWHDLKALEALVSHDTLPLPTDHQPAA